MFEHNLYRTFFAIIPDKILSPSNDASADISDDESSFESLS